jgi:hypothetical protein
LAKSNNRPPVITSMPVAPSDMAAELTRRAVEETALSLRKTKDEDVIERRIAVQRLRVLGCSAPTIRDKLEMSAYGGYTVTLATVLKDIEAIDRANKKRRTGLKASEVAADFEAGFDWMIQEAMKGVETNAPGSKAHIDSLHFIRKAAIDKHALLKDCGVIAPEEKPPEKVVVEHEHEHKHTHEHEGEVAVRPVLPPALALAKDDVARALLGTTMRRELQEPERDPGVDEVFDVTVEDEPN